MRGYFEEEWHGIQFSSFAKLSSSEPAGVEFYNAFYRELFQRYRGFEDLDEAWRRRNGDKAHWIASRLPRGARVLSVGCGLGYMERCLQRERGGDIELHVQDDAQDSLTWLRDELPDERIHLTRERAEQAGPFDVIYMSAVDYALPRREMIALLSDQRAQLRDGGACLLVSSSFLPESSSVLQRVMSQGKDAAKWMLEKIGLRHRGQFWGWMRTQTEYRELMSGAGYVEVTDGFIQAPSQRSYFIEGRRPAPACSR